ncbi:MAG: hypothetical protein CVU18_01930 [Betaproteobacteria bacterium HGW-Betaproteobacteria-12]|jgi:hypothetical protein|nr:MAG: hypothetical protein CVU18_01930 [Betaproteobacteria bacterium HGW-Betaproteobacteria-12]
MRRAREQIRDFPGKRWLNLALRTAHLAGLVLLGAALLGAGDLRSGALLTFGSGLAMFAIDLWANPAHLGETAGAGILVKLALVGLMALLPEHALSLFWLVLALSALLSHAPGAFRHRRLWPPAGRG